MASNNELSAADVEFLANCEQELKDRFTENDVAFMKVFNAEESTPPIIEPWRAPPNPRQNDRNHPYKRQGHRNDWHGQGRYDRRDHHDRRGYNRDGHHQGYRQRSHYY